ncbi:MAG: TRAP transporter substrate-binding protein DctP [Oscillospiraceae bacterium]|nr:TRAP transporter substrate-binding protein DctP [Oscillospiraceae bacterium]
MKKAIALVLALVMALTLLVGCGGAASSTAPAAPAASGETAPAAPAAEKLAMKVATTGNDKHQYTIAAQFFADKVAEISGGLVEATLYPNSSLGSEREMAEGVKMGSIEMTIVTSDGALPSFVPETQVLSIPYLFATKEEAYYALDTYLQDAIAPKFEEQGMYHLGFYELGFRHFTTNNKAIKTAADMQGQSIRVQEAPIWFALADSLGFIATPIAFNELYTALQQGTVDGQENPIASISSSAFDEVQKYMCLDGHTYAAGSMVVNKAWFDGLTAEQQGWIKEAAAYAQEAQRQAVTDMEATMLEGIKANGCAVEENPDIASFQEATADLYLKEEVKALVNPELVEGVRAAVEEFKTK